MPKMPPERRRWPLLSFHRIPSYAESLTTQCYYTHVLRCKSYYTHACRGVNEHVESFCITQPWAIQQQSMYTKTMPHDRGYLGGFTTVLDRERLRDHIHCWITFQMTRGLDLSTRNIQRGISCNTCRLVGKHPRRSVNIRHQIWKINQDMRFLSDWYRPGPWVRCLWEALSWAWPSGVSDVRGKLALLLSDNLSWECRLKSRQNEIIFVLA